MTEQAGENQPNNLGKTAEVKVKKYSVSIKIETAQTLASLLEAQEHQGDSERRLPPYMGLIPAQTLTDEEQKLNNALCERLQTGLGEILAMSYGLMTPEETSQPLTREFGQLLVDLSNPEIDLLNRLIRPTIRETKRPIDFTGVMAGDLDLGTFQAEFDQANFMLATDSLAAFVEVNRAFAQAGGVPHPSYLEFIGEGRIDS